MWRHYLSMALRGFARHKLYSLINIVGLSVAMTCAILILLFVRDQLSYDAWIPDAAHLYRLELTFHAGGQIFKGATCPFPVLRAVGEKIPGVRAVTHVLPEAMTVTVGDRQFKQTVTVVDPNFFEVIRLPLISGTPRTVLVQPDSVVLSQKIARKYFGDTDPVGKTLTVSGVWSDKCSSTDTACYLAVHTLTVTGVLRDLPHDTTLVADLVMPNTSGADEMSQADKEGDWTATDGVYGYVELASGVEPAMVLRDLKPILNLSIHFPWVKVLGSQLEEYHLTPFRDTHLTSDRFGGMTPGGSRTTVYGSAIIALLIVLVACCNFMNLSTARATLRAHEIALRKIAGARRRQLLAQFLGEAVLMALLSLAVALSLVEILLPGYDRFLGAPLQFHYFSDPRLLGALLVGTIGVGVLSGLYPALVLSALRPAAALETGGGVPAASGTFRSMLVVGQFAVSIGLGIAAIVMFRQIEFARRLDLGFRRDGVVVTDSIKNLPPSEREALARILANGPGIVGTALSNGAPLMTYSVPGDLIQAEGGSKRFPAKIFNITPDFAAVYGLHVIAGRLLSAARREDVISGPSGGNVLINADTAHRFGWSPRQAIGRELNAVGSAGRLRVVGVLANAKMDGVRDPVLPAVYLVDPSRKILPSDRFNILSIRVSSDRTPAALSFIDKTWHSFAPNTVLDRSFLSATFAQSLEADERQGAMFAVFVGIAILIGCLGLFGLAVFTAERRTKEIGIRKVSGARTADIVRLMLWRISVPVLVANVIAWPVAYVYLHHWLEGYAYRISLSPLYFVAAGAVALLIAWATVCANTLRLAHTSPIHALRYE